MNEIVFAKDAKIGQWFNNEKGRRFFCCGDNFFVADNLKVVALHELHELTHLPDCTGWDWQPPKPEKKYRPFANAIEYMPHKGRWVYFCDNQSNQLLPYSINDRGIWHAGSTIDWWSLFKQAKFADDGTPFGVEVTE